jgi:hypothetical protein
MAEGNCGWRETRYQLSLILAIVGVLGSLGHGIMAVIQGMKLVISAKAAIGLAITFLVPLAPCELSLLIGKKGVQGPATPTSQK